MIDRSDLMSISWGAITGFAVLVLGAIGFNHINTQSYVTVKGLATREVKANVGIWEIGYREIGDNLVRLNTQLTHDQNIVIQFLENKGFNRTEIELIPTKVTDSLANAYGPDRNTPANNGHRFIVTGGILLRSSQVDQIGQVSQQIGTLLSQNIPITGDTVSTFPNPSYFFTNIDAVRPTMLAEATRSARLLATQFANDADTHLGRIKRANQGVFQLMSRNSEEVSNDQQQLSAAYKKLRLVTTVEYFLN